MKLSDIQAAMRDALRRFGLTADWEIQSSVHIVSPQFTPYITIAIYCPFDGKQFAWTSTNLDECFAKIGEYVEAMREGQQALNDES